MNHFFSEWKREVRFESLSIFIIGLELIFSQISKSSNLQSQISLFVFLHLNLSGCWFGSLIRLDKNAMIINISKLKFTFKIVCQPFAVGISFEILAGVKLLTVREKHDNGSLFYIFFIASLKFNFSIVKILYPWAFPQSVCPIDKLHYGFPRIIGPRRTIPYSRFIGLISY